MGNPKELELEMEREHMTTSSRKSHRKKESPPLSWRRRFFRIGIVCGILGVLMVMFLPGMFTSLIKSQVKLTRDGEMFKNWLQFPIPLTNKFYFFHVLNPEEAMEGEKVQLQEVGPFTFDQWRRKEVIEWGPNDETIKYNEYKKYIFKEELSDDWDQEITTINPVVAGLASNLRDVMKTIPVVPTMISPFMYSVISGVLMAHGHNLFLKTTPRKLLQGHRINIFDTVEKIIEPLTVFGIKKEDLVPSEDLPNNAFGILNGKNDTPSGPFEVYTGINDQSKYTYFLSYKGDRKQNKWRDPECDSIHGTDGAQFPPFRSKKDKLPIFAPDLCRTINLVYDREDTFKGIPVWRMKLDPKLFEPPKMNPDNECFCTHMKKKPDRCSIKGTIDLGGCLKGAPIILSSPHFLGTSPYLGDLVEGLKPDRNKHNFMIMFEPRLGSPVFAYGRLMLSIRVEKTPFLRGFDKIRNAFIPFVWIEESGGVDDFLAAILRTILVYIIDGSQVLGWALLLLGFGVAAGTLAYRAFCTFHDMSSEEELYPRKGKTYPHTRIPHIDSDVEDEVDGLEREGDPLEGEDGKPKDRNGVRNHLKMEEVGKGMAHQSDGGKEKGSPMPMSSAWTPFYTRTKRTTMQFASSVSRRITNITHTVPAEGVDNPSPHVEAVAAPRSPRVPQGAKGPMESMIE